MNFKDYAAADLDNAFFNPSEFCETAVIDGKEMLVMIDNERLQERAAREYGGVTTGMLLYFVRASEYGQPPRVGAAQKFNNKLYYVDSVTETSGIYEILLNQNRGE